MAAGLATGPIGASAIGTVTYVDGDSMWAFGHPLDSVGARSLFLQDAYVYAVVNNPLGSPDLNSYKLAAPGHVVGTLTGDGVAAGAGSATGQGGSLLGAAPVADFTQAATLIDRFELGQLHVTAVSVDLRLRRAQTQAFLDGGHMPHRVRRGHVVRVHVHLLHI